MMHALAQFFVLPVHLGGLQKAMLILPLCLAISVVYKATRLERLCEMPAAVIGLWLTIVVGMYAVGFGLWAVYHVMV